VVNVIFVERAEHGDAVGRGRDEAHRDELDVLVNVSGWCIATNVPASRLSSRSTAERA
jgi:hypothetical protein